MGFLVIILDTMKSFRMCGTNLKLKGTTPSPHQPTPSNQSKIVPPPGCFKKYSKTKKTTNPIQVSDYTEQHLQKIVALIPP